MLKYFLGILLKYHPNADSGGWDLSKLKTTTTD